MPLLLFAANLVCRFVNQLSLYQWLFFIALTLLFLYFCINYAPFLLLEQDIERIQKKKKLVLAISEDADQVVHLSERAGKIWGSRSFPGGVTVKGLDETEAAWLKETKSMLQEAKDLVETFENQRSSRDSRTFTGRLSFAMTSDSFQQIGELFIQTEQVKQHINDIIEKVHRSNMCESLERSRSKIISLLDRPFNKDDQRKWIESKAPGATAVAKKIKDLNHLITNSLNITGEQMHSIKLHLKLLYPFLKDIEGIQFESEIQKAWPEEMEDIINAADLAIQKSRSKIMSLLERPFNKDDQRKWFESKAPVATSVARKIKNLNHLITNSLNITGEHMQSINLHLELLYPFLKDIEGIIESEIQKAWLEEMEDIINAADLAIQKYLHGPVYQIRRLAKRRLEEEMRRIHVRLTELLEMKERYGFKFIRRDSSKFGYQSPHQTTNKMILSSVTEMMHAYEQERGMKVTDTGDPLSVPASIPEPVDNSDPVDGVFYKVKSLCNQLKSMHGHVDDAGMIEGRYNSRKAWSEQTSKIDERVEKSVHTFMKNSSEIWRKGAERALSSEIDRINHTIDLLVKCIKAYSIEFRKEPSSVVGLEEDIHAMVSRLTTSNDHSSSTISIVGIGGIGKTTLANKIYNHQAVVDYFSCCAWVSVSQKSNRNAFLEDVAKQVMRSLIVEGKDILDVPFSPQNIRQQVHDILKEQRYLLILDNISTMEDLDALKAEFPLTTSGRRILFTTCNNDLASKADSPPHKLRLRTEEESWTLFKQMVHFPQDEERVAKQILSKCGGSPLAIVCLGYLMSGKDKTTAEELEMVFKHNEKPLLEMCMRESIKIDHLLLDNQHKRLCYLKLFPMEFEIPARRLIALWIAENLVEEYGEHTTESYEKVAENHLSELIGQDMIQIVERKLNGEVKTCRLPYALEKRISEHMRAGRITHHFKGNGPSNFSDILGESSNVPNCDRTISILSFDTREGNKHREETSNFLRKGIAGGCFRELEVLDLEHLFRPELPNAIGKLSKLRYLGLRWTHLESIPSSIGDLSKLQTLDVKHTYIRTLPNSIWKLQNLLHLYLNQSKFMRQQGCSSLKNLQTLWGAFVDKDSPLNDDLGKWINLRKLGLTFKLDQSEQKALTDGIVKLKHLRFLRLRSIDEMGKPCHLHLGHLSGLENLSSLNLFGSLAFYILCELPTNLTEVTLSASDLSRDPMPELERLSHLKLLCIYSNSYRGKKMVCSAEGFPQLEVLKLWKQPNLTDWDVEEKAMQHLRELEIRSCTNLKTPSGLKHLKTLTKLKLTNMPDEFTATIAETKGQLWNDVNYSPEIISVNWESAEEIIGFHSSTQGNRDASEA